MQVFVANAWRGSQRRAAASPHRTALFQRSAKRSTADRFLSMTKIVCPSDFNAASTAQISARMTGARPSVASSRISNRGLVISARPIASICCSPPDSRMPRLRRRSFRRGNSSHTHCNVQRGSVEPRRAAVATRFSSTVSVGKICLPSGTSPTPRRAIRNDVRPAIGCPSNSNTPPHGGSRPIMAAIVVVLPIPFRPSNASTSPTPTSSETSNSTWLSP